MKMFIKFLGIVFLGLGLMQLADLAFYLMNKEDSYLFNMGLVVFGIIFVAFGYLGLFMLKVLKPEQEEEGKEKEENEL